MIFAFVLVIHFEHLFHMRLHFRRPVLRLYFSRMKFSSFRAVALIASNYEYLQFRNQVIHCQSKSPRRRLALIKRNVPSTSGFTVNIIWLAFSTRRCDEEAGCQIFDSEIHIESSINWSSAHRHERRRREQRSSLGNSCD